MSAENTRTTGYQIQLEGLNFCITEAETPDSWLFEENCEITSNRIQVHFQTPFIVQPTELAVSVHPGLNSSKLKRVLLDPALFIEFEADAETDKHLAEAFYRFSKFKSSGFNSYASVLVFSQHCIVFHFLNGKLQLANSFNGRNPEEILYFILASPSQTVGDAALTRFEVMAPPSLLPGISEVFSRHLPNTGTMQILNEINISEASAEYQNLAFLMKYLAQCE